MRGSLLTLERDGRSEFGGAQGSWLHLMAQFQTQVPHPLRHHLLTLLAPGRVRAPPIGIDFLILVCQDRLKGAAVQVQFNDIAGRECLLRECSEKEFVDDALARDPNGTLLFVSRMGSDHHAA